MVPCPAISYHIYIYIHEPTYSEEDGSDDDDYKKGGDGGKKGGGSGGKKGGDRGGKKGGAGGGVSGGSKRGGDECECTEEFMPMCCDGRKYDNECLGLCAGAAECVGMKSPHSTCGSE